MYRVTLIALSALVVLAAGCGGTSGTDPGGGDSADAPPAAGACLEGVEDCDDTVVGDGSEPGGDDVDEGTTFMEAESLIGLVEEDVLEQWPDVRLGRHGDEEFMLTQDHVPGRMTIATEDDGTGTFRVVAVVVETTDGSETIVADD